jgi:hypothetical protein
MRSQFSKQMSSAGGEEIGQLSRKELDDANLARMGKRPVLKVCFRCCLAICIIYGLTTTAQFWCDVNTGFQLYNSDYLGGNCHVSALGDKK